MYIHRCTFKGKVKLLLRASYRVGRRVKKFTIASVTGFDSRDLARLERLLQSRRKTARANRHPIDAEIFTLLFQNSAPEKRWRLQAKPLEVNRRMGDPVFDFRAGRRNKVTPELLSRP